MDYEERNDEEKLEESGDVFGAFSEDDDLSDEEEESSAEEEFDEPESL